MLSKHPIALLYSILVLDGRVRIIIYSAVLQKNEETNNIKNKSLIFFLGFLKCTRQKRIRSICVKCTFCWPLKKASIGVWCNLFFSPNGVNKAYNEGSYIWAMCWWGLASCENWPCIQSVLNWSLGAIYIPNFLLKSDDTIPKGLIFWTRKFVGEGNKEGGGHGRRGHGILTLTIISVKIFLFTVDSWKIIIPVYPHSYFQVIGAHIYTYLLKFKCWMKLGETGFPSLKFSCSCFAIIIKDIYNCPL